MKNFPHLEADLDEKVPLLNQFYELKEDTKDRESGHITFSVTLKNRVRFVVKGLVVDGWTYVDMDNTIMQEYIDFLKECLEENKES